jgi:hypothetical protein
MTIQGRIQKFFEVREGTTLFEAGGLGAALRPPVGPGQSPWKLLDFISLKHVPQEVIFTTFLLL